MNKDVIFEKLKEVLVAEFEIEAGEVRLEQRLDEDLKLDSLDAVDLVLSLGDHIRGKVDPALFKDARTLADVVNVLEPIWKDGEGPALS